MNQSKYTIEDEKRVYQLRRVEEFSETETHRETNIPPGTISGLLKKYEKRLKRPEIFDDLINSHGLTLDDVMIVLEKDFSAVDEFVVKGAYGKESELPLYYIHALLAEYDLDDEILLNESEVFDKSDDQMEVDTVPDKEYESKEVSLNTIVEANYATIIESLRSTLPRLIDEELDHLKVPVELLLQNQADVSLSDLQTQFADIRSQVREKIVAMVIERLA